GVMGMVGGRMGVQSGEMTMATENEGKAALGGASGTAKDSQPPGGQASGGGGVEEVDKVGRSHGQKGSTEHRLQEVATEGVIGGSGRPSPAPSGATRAPQQPTEVIWQAADAGSVSGDVSGDASGDVAVGGGGGQEEAVFDEVLNGGLQAIQQAIVDDHFDMDWEVASPITEVVDAALPPQPQPQAAVASAAAELQLVSQHLLHGDSHLEGDSAGGTSTADQSRSVLLEPPGDIAHLAVDEEPFVGGGDEASRDATRAGDDQQLGGTGSSATARADLPQWMVPEDAAPAALAAAVASALPAEAEDVDEGEVAGGDGAPGANAKVIASSYAGGVPHSGVHHESESAPSVGDGGPLDAYGNSSGGGSGGSGGDGGSGIGGSGIGGTG
ncbi:hypothetical protein Vafri_5357, partial [Volvox africanus]